MDTEDLSCLDQYGEKEENHMPYLVIIEEQRSLRQLKYENQKSEKELTTQGVVCMTNYEFEKKEGKEAVK